MKLWVGKTDSLFWANVCPFIPPGLVLHLQFSKEKKMARDIITLCQCVKNYDHMMFGFRDI